LESSLATTESVVLGLGVLAVTFWIDPVGMLRFGWKDLEVEVRGTLVVPGTVGALAFVELMDGEGDSAVARTGVGLVWSGLVAVVGLVTESRFVAALSGSFEDVDVDVVSDLIFEETAGADGELVDLDEREA
jgi:hypothetical protein